MRNLRCSGRFLRFLRSIGAKTACARRAIVALFVVVATILATFMIMPSASMGASSQNESNHEQTQSQTKSENVEPKAEQYVNTAESVNANAKDGSVVKDGDKESNTAEPKDSQPSTNPDASNADHAQNVDSTQKQNNAVEGDKKVADKDVAKDADKGAKKDEAANKLRRQKRELGNTRAAAGKVEFPQECIDKGKNTLSSCYKIEYCNSRSIVKSNNPIEVKRGSDITITPEFKFRFGKKQKTTVPEGVWFTLEKYGENPVPSWANFEKDSGATKVQNTENQKGFNGSVTLRPGKWDRGSYKFKIGIYHPADTKGKKIEVSVKIDRSGSGDLTLNVYNHEDSDSTSQRSEIDDKTGITFKSGEDGNYSKITPIFIDSKSKEEPGYIHHHMICHKKTSTNGSAETSESDDSYTLDSVNGLNLKDKDNGTGTQTQFKHVGGKKPSTGADAYSVYEKGDDITERSQSWITDTPTSDGTFECNVFAFKDVKLNKQWHEGMPKQELGSSSTLVKEFDTRAGTQAGMQSLFGGNIVDSNTWKTNDFKQGIDWDYKTIKIVFESKKKKKLDVKDGDLKLSVYPFKNNDSGSGGASAALADGDIVSVMKGIELKPFIEATSKADSTKQITLKMLCSKGEKPQKTNAGAAGGASNASKTGAADLEYTKWVDPSSLGFSFPDDKAQKPCTSNEGEQDCKPDGSDTKFAARTNASATFMSTEAVDYQCVVYALKKPDALAKFNDEAAKPDVTPDNISAAFTSANLTANKDYAKLAINIHVTEKFTLPKTGGQNWNLQLGAVAAVMVSVLAAGFVISQSEACRKLLYERRRC